MKTRSTLPAEAPNIAAIVKARHHARACPFNDPTLSSPTTSNCCTDSNLDFAGSPGTGMEVVADDKPKSRADFRLNTFKDVLLAYGRNFTDIANFIRSRGHRTPSESQSVTASGSLPGDHGSLPGSLGGTTITATGLATTTNSASSNPTVLTSGGGGGTNSATSVAGPSCPTTPQMTSVGPTASGNNPNQPFGGRTREQVRFFYQQTWHKVRRYIKFPDAVPQHVREVYALINYSVIRARIKKPLDHRLGEKLNELVQCGTTVVKHNGRRYLLRTPVCQALKQLNRITGPTHEYLLPEDIWIELVPASQTDLWRVLEAEQNPRLRLRVDINRQLSDLIKLVESKWELAAKRMQTLFNLPDVGKATPTRLLIRTASGQTIDGAIRLQEVARIRYGDMALRSYVEHQPSCSSSTTAKAPVTDVATVVATTADAIREPNDVLLPEPMDEGLVCPQTPVTMAATTTVTVMATSTIPTSISTTHTTTSTTASSGATASAELDLRETGKQLAQGVTFDTARGIKLVTLFLSLGCPKRIQFEYTFISMSKDGTPLVPQNSSVSGPICTVPRQLYHQPVNFEGLGISNGLRRLLHLNASDYLLHRDWLSSKFNPTPSSTSNQQGCSNLMPRPQPITPMNSSAPRPIQMTPTSNCIVGETGPRPVPIPIMSAGVNQLGSMAPPISHRIATASPTLTVISRPPSTIQPTVTICMAGPTVSVLPGVISLAADNTLLGSASTTTTSTTTVTSMTKIAPSIAPSPSRLVFPTPIGPKGKIAIVERQLDHQSPSGWSDKSRPSIQPLPPSPHLPPANIPILPLPANATMTSLMGKIPIPRYPSLASRPIPVPLSAPIKRAPIAIQPRVMPMYTSVLDDESTPTMSHASAIIVQPSSSLSAMKAYNAKRRQSGVRGGRQMRKKTTLMAIGIREPGHMATISTGSHHQLAPLPLAPRTHSTSLAPIQPPHRLPTLTSRPLYTPSSVSMNQPMETSNGGASSLGPLFDHTTHSPEGADNNNSNSQSSALSRDTLVSLLNTMCPATSNAPVGTDQVFNPTTGTTDVDAVPGLGVFNASGMTLKMDHNDIGRMDEHANYNPQSVRLRFGHYKCEEAVGVSGRQSDWSEYRGQTGPSISSGLTSLMPCPSASTPRLTGSESPAFGDISLTDSMAAAVLDNHRDDLDSSNPAQMYPSESSRDPDPYLVSRPVHSSPTESPVSNMDTFLRLIVPTTTMSNQNTTDNGVPITSTTTTTTSSSDNVDSVVAAVHSGVVDLNSLMQSFIPDDQPHVSAARRSMNHASPPRTPATPGQD